MNKKHILFLGIGTYLVLLILSILFYKERTVMFDTAFQLFSMLKDDNFAIQINRFGAVFTQIFPLLASKLGLPLYVVALLYSAGFIFFYATCFFIALLYLKDKEIALSILLFNTVMVVHSFYWIQCEAVQGIVITLLYMAFVKKTFQQHNISASILPISIFFQITIVFFYPLLPLVFLFVTHFFWIMYKRAQKTIVAINLSFIILYCIKWMFFKTNYDDEASSGLMNIVHKFPNYFTQKQIAQIIIYFVKDYYLTSIGFLLVIIFYLQQKEWLKLVVINFFFFGFAFIQLVTHNGSEKQFYIESQYLIFSIFVIIPFVFDVLPSIKISTIKVSLVAFLLLLSVGKIYATHYFYTARLNWNRNICRRFDTTNNVKLIIPVNKISTDTALLTWGFCYEQWLLSTIEKDRSSQSIIEEEQGVYDWALSKNNAFITKWGVFDYANFNTTYFKFSDTSFYIKK